MPASPSLTIVRPIGYSRVVAAAATCRSSVADNAFSSPTLFCSHCFIMKSGFLNRKSEFLNRKSGFVPLKTDLRQAVYRLISCKTRSICRNPVRRAEIVMIPQPRPTPAKIVPAIIVRERSINRRHVYTKKKASNTYPGRTPTNVRLGMNRESSAAVRAIMPSSPS